MRAEIKNTSRALQGVHTVDGLRFIEPGSTRTLDVHGDYVERVNALPFLEPKWLDEGDEPDASNREELKRQAAELGIEHARNITDEKLKELIDAKLAS